MRLPVFATIVEAFSFCWQHRVDFYFLALPPVIVLSILSSLIGVLFPVDTMEKIQLDFLSSQINLSINSVANPSIGLSWLNLVNGFIFFVMALIFPLYSVAWHRIFLVQTENLVIKDYYKWRYRHWYFLWANIKIVLLIMPIVLGGFAITLASFVLAPVVGIFLIFFVSICYARLSMWLPAAALDNKIEFSDVLLLTKGNGWQLAAILIITGLTTGLLERLALGIIITASKSIGVIGDLTQSLITSWAIYIIMYAGMAVGITALSLAYRKLTKHLNYI
jgi:hypothetical protein